MDIAQVARKSGVAASTLRFYEEKGLIASVGRQGLRRRFAPGVLDQLALVALAQTAGFSLDEIRSMFSPDGQPDIDRRMLAAKADEIDRTVKRLQAVSKSLRHAAVCPARSHMECPTFQRLLQTAGTATPERRPRSIAARAKLNPESAP
jgi:DNA-binding transcriptional MerR regulator